jgi:hypothetical protein
VNSLRLSLLGRDQQAGVLARTGSLIETRMSTRSPRCSRLRLVSRSFAEDQTCLLEKDEPVVLDVGGVGGDGP